MRNCTVSCLFDIRGVGSAVVFDRGGVDSAVSFDKEGFGSAVVFDRGVGSAVLFGGEGVGSAVSVDGGHNDRGFGVVVSGGTSAITALSNFALNSKFLLTYVTSTFGGSETPIFIPPRTYCPAVNGVLRHNH